MPIPTFEQREVEAPFGWVIGCAHVPINNSSFLLHIFQDFINQRYRGVGPTLDVRR
jgi:hypothetical protein